MSGDVGGAAHRVALVAGGSGTIGSAIASALAVDGYAVAVHHCAGAERAERVVSSLPTPAVAVEADVRRWADVVAMVDEAQDRLGPIDVLVNAVGERQDALLAGQSPTEWWSVVETNLRGAFHLARAVVPEMLRRRSGHVVNLVSPAAFMTSQGQTAYSAAKAGVVRMTRTLASECARRRVQVNALSPGFVASPMTDGLPEATKGRILAQVPLGRMAEADEIADAVVAMLHIPYMTGHVLVLDGGLTGL